MDHLEVMISRFPLNIEDCYCLFKPYKFKKKIIIINKGVDIVPKTILVFNMENKMFWYK